MPWHADDILDTALTIDAERNELRRRDAEREALKETLASLGLDPALIATAEARVAERRIVVAMERQRRRRRVLAVVLASLATVGGALGAWHVFREPDPWTDPLTDASRWSLVMNQDSSGALAWTQDGDRRSATVFVDLFRPDHRDSWRADLVGVGLPDFERHDLVRLEAQSNLPRARIVLRSGPDERWVSPSVALDPELTTHTFTLRSFEHQRLERRGWDDVDDDDRRQPHDIDAVVIALGDPVNEAAASGWLRVRALTVD